MSWGRKMAFVNEYMGQEDIAKYGLFELRCKYNLELQRDTKENYKERKHIWTIDREREIWLEPGVSINDFMNDRRPTGYKIYTLYVQGKYYEVILTIVTDESSKVSEGVYVRTWKLVSIRPTPEEECTSDIEQIKLVEESLKTESAKHFSDKSVIEVLKEALEVYGFDGMEGPYGLSPRNRVTNIITNLKV